MPFVFKIEKKLHVLRKKLSLPSTKSDSHVPIVVGTNEAVAALAEKLRLRILYRSR